MMVISSLAISVTEPHSNDIWLHLMWISVACSFVYLTLPNDWALLNLLLQANGHLPENSYGWLALSPTATAFPSASESS